MKFEGVNPEFVETLRAGGTLYMERYAELLDSIQYNNPPYIQVDMEKYLGIPQSSISRLLSTLRDQAKVRIRGDYIHRMLDLRVLILSFDDKWIKNTPPLVDWISSAANTFRGANIIYRVPKDSVEDTLETLKNILGEPTETLIIEDALLAKPSIKYYFCEIKEELNPITAFKYNEKHPEVPPRLISFAEREGQVLRDSIDSELIAQFEAHAVYALQVITEQLSKAKVAKPKRKAELHLKHVIPALRGSRVMFLDKDTLALYMTITTSQNCAAHMARILATYPYAANIGKARDGKLFVVLGGVLKARLPDIMSLIGDMCLVDSIRATVVALDGMTIRQYFPYRNFDSENRRWEFKYAALITLEKMSSPRFMSPDKGYIYEWDRNAYIDRLKESMGEDYVKEILDILKRKKP